MKNRISSLMNSLLLRRIAAVAGGNSAAQIITLAFAPVITRIFSPEAFGMQGTFLAALALISPLIALRYPLAIVLAEDEDEIIRVERLSLYVSLATSTLICLVIIMFRTDISRLFGLEELGFLVLLLPLALFLTGCQEIAGYTAVRHSRFRTVSIVSALHALLLNGSRVIGGFIAPSGAVLAVISTLGPGMYAAMLSVSDNKRQVRTRFTSSFTGLTATARKYKDFPLFRAPTDLLYAASHSAPVLILSFAFGTSAAGWFALSQSALTLPANVIGAAIGSVLYPHFAELVRNKLPIFGLSLKSSLALFLGPGLIVLFFSFFGPQIFSFFFGNDWNEAGRYAQFLAILTVVVFCQVPSVRLAPVIGRQDILLTANFLILLTSSAAMGMAIHLLQSPLVTVIAYSTVAALGNFVLLVFLLIAAKRHDHNLISAQD